MRAIELLDTLIEASGAVAFGIAKAEPVEETEWSRFEEWLAKGFHGGMGYMENYPDIRRDPRKLMVGAHSVISTAYNYRQPNPFRGIATYALGEDYHKAIRRRLKAVVGKMKETFGGEWRICIDSAPILERYWARKAGVGKRSETHGNIVVEGIGSMVFLAEIITTLELPEISRHYAEKPQQPEDSGQQRQCCPTGALQPGGTVDARRCINYLTIEKRESLTDEERRLTAEVFFGCDLCQRTCLENQGIDPPLLPEFRPLAGLGEFMEGKPSEFDISKSPMKRRNPTI